MAAIICAMIVGVSTRAVTSQVILCLVWPSIALCKVRELTDWQPSFAQAMSVNTCLCIELHFVKTWPGNGRACMCVYDCVSSVFAYVCVRL
jgi:hypothetical protein